MEKKKKMSKKYHPEKTIFYFILLVKNPDKHFLKKRKEIDLDLKNLISFVFELENN